MPTDYHADQHPTFGIDTPQRFASLAEVAIFSLAVPCRFAFNRKTQTTIVSIR